jgi:broad specificity phosphatase PhoE
MPPLLYCLVATPILVLAATVNPSVAAPDAGPATIIVIRHAERADDDPHDPSLSAAGQARARALVDVLEHAGVTAVYCTQYRRTCATAEPLAQHLGIQVSARTAGAGTVAEDARALARDIVVHGWRADTTWRGGHDAWPWSA